MSKNDIRPFQLCYLSDLVPGTTSDAVSVIPVVSRHRNLAVGISGALLFDGGRFCQLLEGSEIEVRLLMTRIAIDRRHRDVSITAAGYYGLPRLTNHWRFGRCSPLAMEPVTVKPLAQGEVALALFMSALAFASIE